MKDMLVSAALKTLPNMRISAQGGVNVVTWDRHDGARGYSASFRLTDAITSAIQEELDAP